MHSRLGVLLLAEGGGDRKAEPDFIDPNLVSRSKPTGPGCLPSPPVSLTGWMLGRNCQLECWDPAVAEREDSGAGAVFLHPAPLCTWSLCYTHFSYLCPTSPSSSPVTTPLPTLEPRNTHLLVYWMRQAVSPLQAVACGLSPTMSPLSLFSACTTLVNLAKCSSYIGHLSQESPSLSGLGSSGHQPS